MAQHSNEHLTGAELSAFLDKELAPEELARCDAHIQTCQTCRTALADLRLTSALLGGMPQVEVPRSFVLPTNLLTLPETPPTSPKTPALARSPSLAPSIWRRTMRTASTLVALLGLFFCLAAFTALPHGGVSMNASTHSSAGSAPVAASRDQANATASVQAAATLQTASPNAAGTRIAASSTSTHTHPGATPTPTPLSTQQADNGTSSPEQPVPAALDLSQASGRLTVGGSLILLGLLGVLITHLFERSSRQ